MLRKVFAPLAALALVAGVAGAASAQTVDALIAKNLETKGGADKWKAVKTMRMTGRVNVQGMELPMTMLTKRPNMMRQEVAIQDRQIVSATDGTTVWTINPMLGSEAPTEMTGPQADALRDQADFDGALVSYKEKGHTVELVGAEDMDGVKVHHLKLTKKGGDVQHYYLDADSGIELKVVFETEVPGQGTMEIETELSNYQMVDGMLVPMSIKQIANGMVAAQITVDKVEFNVPIDDAQFKMPGK